MNDLFDSFDLIFSSIFFNGLLIIFFVFSSDDNEKCVYYDSGTFVIEIPPYKRLDITSNKKVYLSVVKKTSSEVC